jgi:predicted phosphodiesterase
MKLLELEPKGKFVFVGDTHGDVDASRQVISQYLNPNTRICFLGDYVDKGPASKKNIAYLLKIKEQNPERVILLQGNHENYPVYNFSPADFWEWRLDSERKEYHDIFREFPLVASVGNIIALHGALPNINCLKDIEQIKEKDDNWTAITWGDLYEGEKDYFYTIYGRPRYGRNYFNNIMGRLGKKILIRSHDPGAREKMFDNQCLTIFTSCAYGRKRTVAIADFNRRIESVEDLIIEGI